jgi:hypothetical protein
MPDDKDITLSDAEDGEAVAESSTASETVEASQVSKDAKTLADVVRETAAKSKTESSTVETEEEPSTEAVDKTEPDDEKETEEKSEDEEKPPEVAVVDEKDKSLPFHKHPRFQELTKERLAFKKEVEELKPMAEQAKALSEYCHKNSISNAEFQSAMHIAAMLHSDPAKALTELQSYVDVLEQTLGSKLPSDLQKEVDDGMLSLERAKELTKARLANQGLEQRGKQSEAQAAQAAQTAITSAVNSWDAQKRASDPIYDKKYPLIEKAFLAACSMTPPRSPQEAITLAERAYAEVNAALGSFTPKPPKRKVLTTNGSVTKSVITIDPKEDFRTALPKIVRKVVQDHTK